MSWSAKTLHHLSDEMAKSSDPDLPCPPEIVTQLEVLVLPYRDFQDCEHWGQLVVHKRIAERVKTIFRELLRQRFPIGSMVPIATFAWDDARSMAANNTSGFNYRYIKGKKKLSDHAYGLAIDINPLLNPCISEDGVEPQGAWYAPWLPGTIAPDSEIVRLFHEHGFLWGGAWDEPLDLHHFYMPTDA